jgi:4-hydroxy-3-methylbut-2-en-1-yl diphosphate reductase
MIALVVILCLQMGNAFSFAPQGMRQFAGRYASSLEGVKTQSARDERREILKSPNYNRQGFKGEKKGVSDMMVEEFTSPLVQELRDNGGVIQRGDITVKLAEHYGFCWGVERAVAMAYESRSAFPDSKIHITNEIIHNPQVNDRLHEMDIKFIDPADTPGGMKDFSDVKEGEVVILPAFGATIEEMRLLNDRNVKIIDTTCPWVSKVWNAVDRHIQAGKTTIIHGKWAHEETVATASFCTDYLIVKDQTEADYVTNYIINGGNKVDFMKKFKNAMSKGFDPDVHLKKVGLANQTTMYKRETKAIGRTFEMAMLKKYGPDKLMDHYAEFDTICDATQERQDAVTELSTNINDKLDFVLVVGGFDSSNTAHLKEIPEKYGVPAYHIDRPERIGADNSIEHRQHDGSIHKLTNFMKKGSIKIGVTSGASTPDKCMEDALERLFMVHKLLE